MRGGWLESRMMPFVQAASVFLRLGAVDSLKRVSQRQVIEPGEVLSMGAGQWPETLLLFVADVAIRCSSLGGLGGLKLEKDSFYVGPELCSAGECVGKSA